MVLPGIQALFGFQLIAVFNRPFFDLGAEDRAVHLTSLLLVGVAIGLIIAPAAYRRLVQPGSTSSEWVEMASRQIARAMAALLVAISFDTYVVTVVIARSHAIGLMLAVLLGGFLAWLWFAIPLLERRRHSSTRH